MLKLVTLQEVHEKSKSVIRHVKNSHGIAVDRHSDDTGRSPEKQGSAAENYDHLGHSSKQKCSIGEDDF